jgi:hypothetical protein
MLDGITPETYSDVFTRLEAERVRYVVVSGVAVVLHGCARPLADLDIVIDPAPYEAQRALNVLLTAGFMPTLPLPLSLVTVMRMFDRSQREIDVFVRYSIPFEELWADSQLMPVGACLVRVMSFEHLLRAKRFNNRPHDLQDIERLLER